ncbi:MAG: RsiV family protein, partial [Muribaculum sp.]|nr:RsiV family protein [Muribaculum sp.]
MNIKLLIWIVAASFTLATVACKNGTADNTAQASDNGITDFEIKQTVKSLERNYICEGAETYYDDSTEVYSTVRIAIEWPEVMGGNDLKTLKDSLLATIFDKPEATINASMLKAAENPEGADLFKMKLIDSIPTMKPAMVYSRDMIASIITFSPKFISYQIMTAIYNGGAHGMAESRYINYDFATGKVLTYDNAFKPDSEAELLNAIKDNLMTRYNVSSMKELDKRGIFADQIYVSKNFYLQGYDIVFHYNPYEIAPYSEGSINVRVPYFQ